MSGITRTIQRLYHDVWSRNSRFDIVWQSNSFDGAHSWVAGSRGKYSEMTSGILQSTTEIHDEEWSDVHYRETSRSTSTHILYSDSWQDRIKMMWRDRRRVSWRHWAGSEKYLLSSNSHKVSWKYRECQSKLICGRRLEKDTSWRVSAIIWGSPVVAWPSSNKIHIT